MHTNSGKYDVRYEGLIYPSLKILVFAHLSLPVLRTMVAQLQVQE